MTESKTNKDSLRRTFKVSDEVFDWVKTRQEEDRKRTGKQPTQSAVVLELIQSFEASIKNKSTTFPHETVVAQPSKGVKHLSHKTSQKQPTRVEQLWLTILQDILESDHPTAVPAIKSNLQAFGELIRIARGEEVEAIRAFFDTAFREFEQNARELQEYGERTAHGKANPSKRRGAA